MQTNIDHIKLQLISQIMNIQNIYFLEKLARMIPAETAEDDMLQKLSTPMPKTLDIDAIKKSQGFTHFDKEKMYQLRAEINLIEPIEPLIEML